MDALNIAAAGMMSASQNFDASAERTVNGTGDLVTETVNQIEAKQTFEASAAVVKTDQQMFKALLDIKV